MSVAWQFRDTNQESRCRTRHIQIRTMYRWTVNKTTWSNLRNNAELFTFPSEFSKHPMNGWVFIINECVNESFSRSIFNATRTGSGFNKMRAGNGLNKVIRYIPPSKQEREILFEATRTSVWLKVDVCSMRVRSATQQRYTSGLINHLVKYFAKANSAFTLFLHRRFIVYQFKTVSLFLNRDSKVKSTATLRSPLN